MRNKNFSLILICIFVFTVFSCSKQMSYSPTTESSTSLPKVTQVESVKPTDYPQPSLSVEMKDAECIKSFNDFVTPENTRRKYTSVIPPLHPWTFETALPKPLGNSIINPPNVMLVRQYNGLKEIWISTVEVDGDASSKTFLIYKPDLQSWNIITGTISDTNLPITNIFLTSDNSIWGQISFTNLNSDTKDFSILARYNEKIERFEAVTLVGNLSGLKSDKTEFLDYSPVVLLDNQDVFWIFTLDGGIYRFHAFNGLPAQKVGVVPESFVLQAALSPDGSIFLQKYPQPFTRGYLADDIMHFSPGTGKVIAVDKPDNKWPMVWISSILVDHLGRLWLDANGYWEPNSGWHVTHPDMEKLASNLGEPFWSVPAIELESSDGTLWFVRNQDNNYIDGLAWYNPETRTGCMFTNRPGRIREDNENVLWLVIDGALYKYRLSSNN